MTRTTSILILVLAAGLEAGGDALMRFGIHSHIVANRLVLFAIAAIVLFAYGWTVNAPPWDFGKLLGLYVVFFFLFAQVISIVVFKANPSMGVVVGGGLILAGGIVIAISNA